MAVQTIEMFPKLTIDNLATWSLTHRRARFGSRSGSIPLPRRDLRTQTGAGEIVALQSKVNP